MKNVELPLRFSLLIMILCLGNNSKAQKPIIDGWLTTDVSVNSVITHWGQPAQKSDVFFSESSGMYEETWQYNNGISLFIQSDSICGEKIISYIKAESPCKYPIIGKIKIGSEIDSSILDGYVVQTFYSDGLCYISIVLNEDNGYKIVLECNETCRSLISYGFGWLDE